MNIIIICASFYLLNHILRKSTICLENIDSNKIRGEGVYNDPAPLRSARSYFYILQLFSTDPDGWLCTLLLRTFWFQDRVDGGDPERLLRVLNIIERPSHNCYTEGDPPPIVMWATVFHMLPHQPPYSLIKTSWKKNYCWFKEKRMALCVFVSKWGDFNWEDVPEIYRMPNLLPSLNKNSKK